MAMVVDEMLEQRSKALFGNRHMLRVAHEIAVRPGPFTVTDVATSTGVPYSSVHRLVHQLDGIGLVVPSPAASAEQHRWYTRAPAKFWDAAQELCQPADQSTKTSRTRKDRGR